MVEPNLRMSTRPLDVPRVVEAIHPVPCWTRFDPLERAIRPAENGADPSPE